MNPFEEELKMNFAEKMIELMVANGMFESQAKEVMQGIMKDHDFGGGSMVNRWDDNIDGYSDVMVHVIWTSVKDEALEWIELNAPQAWFKPMFFSIERRNSWLKEQDAPEHLVTK
jgi:hypothetical protein